MEDGHEVDMFHSLVACPGRVRFSKIHGLTADDLVGAPTWPRVWRALLGFAEDASGEIPLLVAYRAAFDRGAVLSMYGFHGLRAPRLRFCCAADMVRRRFGHPMSLRAALCRLGVPFPGRPHDPRADARAAASVALACERLG